MKEVELHGLYTRYYIALFNIFKSSDLTNGVKNNVYYFFVWVFVVVVVVVFLPLMGARLSTSLLHSLCCHVASPWV